MTRRTTPWTYLGFALLVGGLLLAGTGAATHVNECQQSQSVRIINTEEVTRSLDEYDRVAYESLTSDQQRLFDSVQNVGGQALTSDIVFPTAVITRENESYLAVTTTQDTDCAAWDTNRVVVPLAAGSGLTVAGLGLIRGREHDPESYS